MLSGPGKRQLCLRIWHSNMTVSRLKTPPKKQVDGSITTLVLLPFCNGSTNFLVGSVLSSSIMKWNKPKIHLKHSNAFRNLILALASSQAVMSSNAEYCLWFKGCLVYFPWLSEASQRLASQSKGELCVLAWCFVCVSIRACCYFSAVENGSASVRSERKSRAVRLHLSSVGTKGGNSLDDNTHIHAHQSSTSAWKIFYWHDTDTQAYLSDGCPVL